MNDHLNRKLKENLKENVHATCQQFLEDPGVDLTEPIRRIETASKLLAARNALARDNKKWAIVVSLTCLIITALLWGMHISKTAIVLNIRSEIIGVKLAETWSWEGALPINSPSTRLNGLTNIDAPILGPPISSPQSDAWMRIENGKVDLAKLHVEKDSTLEVKQHSNGHFVLHSRGGTFSGELRVLGAPTLKVSRTMTGKIHAVQPELFIPETIVFTAEPSEAVPATIQAYLNKIWTLHGIPIAKLGLHHIVPDEPAEVARVSGILEGTLRLPEVSRTIVLQKEDFLTLGDIQNGRITTFKMSKNGISFVFQGTAKGIWLGPENFVQSLAPTYLEFLYHNEPLMFFGTIVSVLWGILWGIRQTLFV